MTTQMFETISNDIQERRKLSEASMIKYRQKLKKFHTALCGADASFSSLDFLHEKHVQLLEEIKKDKPTVARSSYSCLLGAVTNKDQTAISPAYNDVVNELRMNMELLNQAYVDKKAKEPHSVSQLENWVSVSRLKKFQRKMMRDAMEVVQRAKKTASPLTWGEFKVIQRAMVVTLYVNYRKAGEHYPTWYKAIRGNDLPDNKNESHIAPKRLEWGDIAVDRTVGERDASGNAVVVTGALARHKRLWFSQQKNSDAHFEPVNNILNKAINIQLWAVERYLEAGKPDKLLILKNGERMNKPNLSAWIGQSFESLGVEMTANTLRHITAEEQGVGPEDKKLLKEQLLGMNHSNQVHDLAYST